MRCNAPQVHQPAKVKPFLVVDTRSVEKTIDVSYRICEEFVNHSPAARDLQILLVFYQHPAWFIRAPDQVVLEGGPAINLTCRTCTADGEPAPNITCTKVFANGSESGVLFTGDQFILSSNRTIDGTYCCKASNGIGSDVNHTFTVVVHCEYCLLYVLKSFPVHISFYILFYVNFRALISSYDPHFLHFNNRLSSGRNLQDLNIK